MSNEILSQFSRPNNSAFLANGSEIIGLRSSKSRDDDQAIIYNIETGKLVRKFPVVHASYGLAVSPNGKYLVVGRNAAVGKNPVSATIYSLETGEELQTVPLIGTPHILAFSLDSRLLAGLCHSFGQITLWDVEHKSPHPLSADNITYTTKFDSQGYLQLDSLNRKQIVDWKNHKTISNVIYTRTNASQCFTSDNKFYIDIELPKDNMAVCHTFIRETVTQQTVGKIEGIAGITDAMRFVDRDRLLVTVTYDDALSVWDVASRKLLWSERYPKDSITYAGANVAIRSFDGVNPCVAICSYITQTDKTFLDTWDLRRRVKISSVELPILPDKYFDLSKDGKYVVVEVDKAISLLRASDGKTIHRLEHLPGPFRDQNDLRCDFSPDNSKLLTTDSSGTIRLWELATGKLIRTFTGHRGWTSASFSPDGRWIAGVSCDAPVFIWDVYGIKTKVPFDGDRLWKGLTDADAARAFESVRELIASPKEAIALLKEKLQPETLDQKTLDQLVADLASPRFAVREKASADLAKYGKGIETFLRRSYDSSTDEEAKQRLKALLDQTTTFTPEMLRRRRALDVLEHIEITEAKPLLEKLSQGSADSDQTQEAKEALSRLATR